ncbi:ACR3 family arsenite efflux pump ArsB [Planomicrobium stackebrandtii]|uniref:ACR3 family arsenite efflux pump ArsB n=1 Tax=Planomicrobium stackebrandtii TaxID=253160 RepID=A0ABU0GVR0_9BACL|nr:arsenic resistance protein [Planomicrobium stackebrandtii]MDQ0429451.1 ACR3 family arsenite efflux pump ArsB [Planomicrobium stackebrandtii]
MSLFEKLYTVLILLAAVIGIGAGQIEAIRTNAEHVIIPLLLVMLYLTFLQIPLQKAKQAFGNIRFSSVTLLMNFVWTPLLAWFLASLFLGDQPALYIGFIMLLVTPCTDWYLVFTGIAKGNLALSTAILPVNLILQIILLPFYLLLFGGTAGVIELSFLLESVVAVLLLPLLLAIATKVLAKNRTWPSTAKWSALPVVFLSLAIAAMFASQGDLLLNNLDLLWHLLVPILLFFVINFIVGQKAGGLMKFSYEDTASLNLTTLARNSPIALAIALTAFPNQPLIALTLVIGPLLELPVLAVATQVLLSLRKRTLT